MKSIFAAIVIVWLSTGKLFAQADSLKLEILYDKDDRAETIIKGRQLTLATYLNNAKKKVNDQLQYLQPHVNAD